MKCRICGAENESSAVDCAYCGAPLKETPRAEQPASSARARQDRRTLSPKRRIITHTTAAMLLQKGLDAPEASPEAFSDKPVVVLADETRPLEPIVPSRRPSNAQQLQDIPHGETVNVVLTPEPAPKRKRRKVRWGRFFGTLALCLLVLALLGGGVYFGFTYGKAWFLNWRAERQLAALPQQPKVERVMLDGQSWHRITFYGKDGERVLVNNPTSTLAIHNGTAELLLDDASYIGDDPDPEAATVPVEMTATLVSIDGSEQPIPIPDFSIDVPRSPLQVISPQEQDFTVNETRIVVTIQVEPGSRVLVGSHNVTDQVNSEGKVTTTVEVEPTGRNLIPISVETRKHRKNVYEIAVTREPMSVPIDLDTSVKSSTEGNSVLIEGVTEAGASITTTTATEGDIQVGADGKFRFTAKLARYGYNEIEITATTEDGRRSALTHRVNREAALSSYTREAWAMDYGYLKASADAIISRVFECKGVIKEVISDDLRNLFVMDVGTDQLIVLEYNGSVELTPGKSYRVFADVQGRYDDGKPLLTARFVFTQ